MRYKVITWNDVCVSVRVRVCVRVEREYGVYV